MRAKSASYCNRLQLAARYLYGGGFDNRIQDERAARLPLAISAMAAVHSDRLLH